MLLAELGTAIQYECHIVIIILNNGVLQRVSAQQAKSNGVHLYNPDFAALANAFGAEGVTVYNHSEFQEALTQSLKPRNTPFIINAMTSPELFATIV